MYIKYYFIYNYAIYSNSGKSAMQIAMLQPAK